MLNLISRMSVPISPTILPGTRASSLPGYLMPSKMRLRILRPGASFLSLNARISARPSIARIASCTDLLARENCTSSLFITPRDDSLNPSELKRASKPLELAALLSRPRRQGLVFPRFDGHLV